MAAKIRPIFTVSYEIEFFPNDWSDLESLTGLKVSEEIRLNLIESIQEYVREANALRRAVLGSKVKATFEKVGNACSKAGSELTKMQDLICPEEWGEFSNAIKDATLLNEKINGNDDTPTEIQETIDLTDATKPETTYVETDPYHIAREIIESEYGSRFGIELDLYSTTQTLKSVATLCDFFAQDERLESLEISDSHLNIFLNRLAEIYSGLGENGPTSEKCLNFIRALCVRVIEYLKQSGIEKEIFNKLDNVISYPSGSGHLSLFLRLKQISNVLT